jgi:hypothetical protein
VIKRKKKKCSGCGNDKYLYARGMCIECDRAANPVKHGIQPSKPKKRKRINPVSDKLAEERKKYRPLRDKYMKNHPNCEFKGCTRSSQDLHHTQRRGKNLCNVATFMAVCRIHHDWIEENPIEAGDMGYLPKSLKSEEY